MGPYFWSVNSWTMSQKDYCLINFNVTELFSDAQRKPVTACKKVKHERCCCGFTYIPRLLRLRYNVLASVSVVLQSYPERCVICNKKPGDFRNRALCFPKIKLTYIYAVTGSREEPFGLNAGCSASFSIRSAIRLE